MEKELETTLRHALQTEGKDIVGSNVINSRQMCTGSFITKLPGICSGYDIVSNLYGLVNTDIELLPLKEEGAYVNKGDALISIKGKLQDVLRAGRIAASILDIMGSIAYNTSKYVEEVQGLKCEIVANYKILPALYNFSKQAIESVGGKIYEYNLFDYAYINEMHIMSYESITDCVNSFRKRNKDTFIEIEVRNIDEYNEALSLNVNRIRLVGIDIDDLHDYLIIPHKDCKIGYSGNISIGKVRMIAKKGINYIIIDDLGISVKPMGVYLKIYKRSYK